MSAIIQSPGLAQKKVYRPTGLSTTVGELIEELRKAVDDSFTHIRIEAADRSIETAVENLLEKYFQEEPVSYGQQMQVLLP